MKTQEHGWLRPYLLAGDKQFCVGRWDWWLSVDGIPEGPIPQIKFVEPTDDTNEVESALKLGRLTANTAYQHVRGLLDEIGPSWGALRHFLEWLGWGLGIHDKRGTDDPWDVDDVLFRKFQLGRLQAARADVLGRLLSENLGKGWNPGAFYPTPQNVVNMMVELTMHDVGPDRKEVSVCDPCVGTGRMLLAASNYSVNLHGQDIDPLCVLACKINAMLFMPWLVAPKVQTPAPLAKEVSKVRVEQGHPPIPKKHRVTKQGQLCLFEETE